MVQIRGVNGQRAAEGNPLVHGNLVAARHLSVARNLAAQLRITVHLRHHAQIENGHVVQGRHLADSGETRLVVDRVQDRQVRPLEHVVANARVQHVLVSVGHADIRHRGIRQIAARLRAEQEVFVLQVSLIMRSTYRIHSASVVLLRGDIERRVHSDFIRHHLHSDGRLLHSRFVVVLERATHQLRSQRLPQGDGGVLRQICDVHVTDHRSLGVNRELLHRAVFAGNEIAGNLVHDRFPA